MACEVDPEVMLVVGAFFVLAVPTHQCTCLGGWGVKIQDIQANWSALASFVLLGSYSHTLNPKPSVPPGASD